MHAVSYDDTNKQDNYLSSENRGLYFGLSLHPHPYFVSASSKGSDETVYMCRLI